MSHLLLSRPMVAFVLFVERWLLSAVFLFLAYESFSTLQLLNLIGQSQNLMPRELIARDAGLSDGCHFADYARYGLLGASNLVSGALLLTSRKPRRQPNQPSEVIVPLAATFSYLLFNQPIPYPAWMTMPLVPAVWESPLAVAGLGLCFAGSMFSLAAMLWLGRSLGVVISVREVILGGPYHFVRHPIYLGYFVILLGLLCTSTTCRMLALTLGAAAVLVWRARLEERALCEYSAAYRARMPLTGRFWPKPVFFWRSTAKSAAGVSARSAVGGASLSGTLLEPLEETRSRPTVSEESPLLLRRVSQVSRGG